MCYLPGLLFFSIDFPISLFSFDEKKARWKQACETICVYTTYTIPYNSRHFGMKKALHSSWLWSLCSKNRHNTQTLKKGGCHLGYLLFPNTPAFFAICSSSISTICSKFISSHWSQQTPLDFLFLTPDVSSSRNDPADNMTRGALRELGLHHRPLHAKACGSARYAWRVSILSC